MGRASRKIKEANSSLRPKQLIIRCFAEKRGDVWQAFCLDFNLCAQGTSLSEVKHKLHEQIDEYVYDAVAGEDAKYGAQLLSRKAPFGLWAKYYLIRCLHAVRMAHDGMQELFYETMPLAPACHHR